MNVFMLEYSGGSISGTAFVASNSINNAISYLRNNGDFNGTPQVYQITNIQCITKTDMEPCIISEIYKNPGKIAKRKKNNDTCTTEVRTVTKYVEVPSQPSTPDKPVDNNTLPGIIANNKSRILKVDRIGTLKTTLTQANIGYLAMLSPSTSSHVSNDFVAQYGHLYLWNGVEWVDLGMPNPRDLDEIRSAVASINVHRATSEGWATNNQSIKRQHRQMPATWYNPFGKIRTGLFFTGRNSRVPRLVYRLYNEVGNYRKGLQNVFRALNEFVEKNPILLEDTGGIYINITYRPLLAVSNIHKNENGQLIATITFKFFIGTYVNNGRPIKRNRYLRQNLFNLDTNTFRTYPLREINKVIYVRAIYSSKRGIYKRKYYIK